MIDDILFGRLDAHKYTAQHPVKMTAHPETITLIEDEVRERKQFLHYNVDGNMLEFMGMQVIPNRWMPRDMAVLQKKDGTILKIIKFGMREETA